MDLALIISALSLLLAGLSEIEQLKHDRDAKKQRTLGIGLLQVIVVLDRIIETGDKLITQFARVPITEDEDFKWAIIRIKMHEVIPLIQEQQHNIDNLISVLDTPLTLADQDVEVSLGDSITILVPHKTRLVRTKVDPVDSMYKAKLSLLKRVEEVLSWKQLKGKIKLGTVKYIANIALKSLLTQTDVSRNMGTFIIEFPTHITVKQSNSYNVEDIHIEKFDVTKPSNLRRLLQKAKEQLDSIKELRKALAESVQQGFTVETLLGQ